MKKIIGTLGIVFFVSAVVFGQGFKVKATGNQTFNFVSKDQRNQTSFFSAMPVEDIRGLAAGVEGNISFDVKNVASTLKGKITIATASIKTGIDLRDEHMRSAGWLDAEKYPEISFTIKKVSDVKSEADNKIKAKVSGDFTLRGVTKEVVTEATLTYLDESEKTKMRAPGDLLGIQAEFDIKLSDYGVKNDVIGNKVADNIEIDVNIVGSNAAK